MRAETADRKEDGARGPLRGLWRRADAATGGVAGDILRSAANVESGRSAAAVTFYLFLAIFPALAVFVSFYGLVADPMMIRDHVGLLEGFAPPEALDLISNELRRINATRARTLGISLLVSILFSLWSANNGMRALLTAISGAYGDREERGFFALLGLSLLFTIGAVLFGTLVLNILVAMLFVLRMFGLERLPDHAATLGPPAFLFLSVNIAVAALYRWGPNRPRPRLRWFSAGSVTATLAWMTTSAAFVFYLSNFANFGAAYGSLGAVIGVMMWMYVSIYVVIVGAELNARLERRTAAGRAVRRKAAP